jgi:carboxymethylenebutenolidase
MPMITLTSADGFSFAAYHAEAEGPRKGGLILIQEIFGVNADIRRLSDEFAARGFEVLAPSMFDRVAPGFATDEHTPEMIQKTVGYAQKIGMEAPLQDVAACGKFLSARGPVFITGFCYGGSVSYLAACKIPGLAAASSFYGSMVPGLSAQKPLCPTIVHFGETDGYIPLEGVKAFAAARSDVPTHIYPAGHGFFGYGAGHHAESAKLALDRTLTLFTAA